MNLGDLVDSPQFVEAVQDVTLYLFYPLPPPNSSEAGLRR